MNYTYDKKNNNGNIKNLFNMLQNNNNNTNNNVETQPTYQKSFYAQKPQQEQIEQDTNKLRDSSNNVPTRKYYDNNNNNNSNYHRRESYNNNATRGSGFFRGNRGGNRGGHYNNNNNNSNSNSNNEGHRKENRDNDKEMNRSENINRDKDGNRGGYKGNNYNNRSYNNQPSRSFMNPNYKTIFQTENTYAADQVIRKQLINYLYSMTKNCNRDYKIMESIQDLEYLSRNKYFLFPNYKGTPGFLIFIKICEDYYSCVIDRTSLKYNKTELDYDGVKIIPIKARVCEDIYSGTIMDGVFNTGPITGNSAKPTFYIDDVLYLGGNNVFNSKIINKNINLNSYLSRCYVNDDQISTINLKVNTIYEIDEIRNLVDFIKDKRYIKGITFYPELNGTKLLYIDRNTDYSMFVGNNNSNQETSNNFKSSGFSDEDDNEDIDKKIEMKQKLLVNNLETL